MAVMIPSVLSPDIKSTAERRIFRWFEESSETEDWIVLHSLGINNHKRVIHGEVDFFVLVPGLGIFALEVKGGRIKRENGIWHFTDKYNHTDSKSRGPFDQAWEGIYSIRTAIREKLDQSHQYLKNVFFGIGVMFPDVSYSSTGIDEEQWQVFDCNDGNNVKGFIKRIANGSIQAWERQYGTVRASNRPSIEDVRYLANLLRGDFDMLLSLRVQYNYSEDNIIKLTNEQYRCIDQLEDNPRCLIRGAAGTGKTLLAIEEVKKAASRGERVAMFCFNNTLGAWLNSIFKQMPGELQPIYVGTIHGYMAKIIRENGGLFNPPSEENDLRDFYNETLPEKACSFLQNSFNKLDKVIVDETQDLMSDKYLDFIDSCLRKGLQRGKWMFFGDFLRQAIYTRTMDETKFIDELENRTSFSRYKLTINCRNSKNICEEVKTIAGISNDIPYQSLIEGPQVQYLTYTSKDDEKQKLINLIVTIRDNTVEPGRITILSPRKRENSVISLLQEKKINDYCIPEIEDITFSTIQGFKGLENTVIILTDIENYEDENLMYVAFSRARTGLYILESESARKEYVELFSRRNFR